MSYPVQRALSRYDGEEKKKKSGQGRMQDRYIIEEDAGDNRKVASSRGKHAREQRENRDRDLTVASSKRCSSISLIIL